MLAVQDSADERGLGDLFEVVPRYPHQLHPHRHTRLRISD
jgi:hypothetical protein